MSTCLQASQSIQFKPHISINVSDVDASVDFYSKLFGVTPVKHYRDATTVHSVLQDDQGLNSQMARSGYAKFDLQTPALNFVLNEIELPEALPALGALSHMGLQVADTDAVLALRERALTLGMPVRDEMAVSCCYARQDKFWLADPDGNEWEVFTVLEHLSPEQLKALDQRGTSCSVASGTANACVPDALLETQAAASPCNASRCATA
jgi:catechol 2,3-dioxygenase-like lactoylglutathione lyase family enzyme